MKHFPIILASTALLLLALAAWWVSKMQEALDERPDPNQAGLEELLPKKEAAAPGGAPSTEPADSEPEMPEDPVYTMGEKTRDGTGKYYMGREIAYVMGHQAINWLERDNREDEEAPSKAIAALDLKPDSILADIGAGSGYYTFRIAPLVPKGKVVAVDIQPEMIAFLEAREKELGFDNVAECVEPPHTWLAYSIQGRTRPLYIVRSCVGEKNCRRRYRTPNLEEADLVREEM